MAAGHPGARPPGPGQRAPGPAARRAARRHRRGRRRPGRRHRRPDRPLTALSAQIKALETQIAGQLAAHPDGHIFTSLPRPGTVRAARLLAEIGDCRSASPTPNRWPGWPGSHQSPRKSGKHTSIGFRWAVNRQLSDAVWDFAASGRPARSGPVQAVRTGTAGMGSRPRRAHSCLGGAAVLSGHGVTWGQGRP